MWVGVAVAAGIAVVTAAATPTLLRRFPEPTDDPDAVGKTPYAALATRRFMALVASLALASGLAAFTLTGPTSWPAWAALVAPGAIAVAVDGATTWIPRALTTTMAAVGVLGVGLESILDADPLVAARAAGGAVAVGGFFYVFWFLTRGIGFADVRLMAVVGGVTAAHSVQLAVWAVLAGTLLGAVWGVVRRVVRGPGEFAYGPSLWAGPFLALAITLVR